MKAQVSSIKLGSCFGRLFVPLPTPRPPAAASDEIYGLRHEDAGLFLLRLGPSWSPSCTPQPIGSTSCSAGAVKSSGCRPSGVVAKQAGVVCCKSQGDGCFATITRSDGPADAPETIAAARRWAADKRRWSRQWAACLLYPPHRHPLHQPRQRHPLRLPPRQYRLDHAGREQRQPQHPRDIGWIDFLRRRQRAGSGNLNTWDKCILCLTAA